MKTRMRYLIAGLAAAFLLVTGAGAVYAAGQMGSMMGGDGGTNSMMMDEGDGMGSMMGGGGMGEGQMMGSFDEDKPFDLQFIDQMTMHHEGAIMSSEMMIGDSKRPELRELAANIEESQSAQIETMKDMREQWYPDAGDTSGTMGGDGMGSMMGDGMMEGMMGGSMQEMMGGDATDEMFLEMMIPHHQMAVDMSEKALEESERPELKELAGTIKEEQTAEIELMRGYLEEIEGSTEGR